MPFYLAYVSGISPDILSGILSELSSEILCGRGSARVTFIQRLLFGSGGEHCDLALAIEVRQGPLRSRACNWGPAWTTLILGLLFGSGRDHCDHELAVEGLQRPP